MANFFTRYIKENFPYNRSSVNKLQTAIDVLLPELTYYGRNQRNSTNIYSDPELGTISKNELVSLLNDVTRNPIEKAVKIVSNYNRYYSQRKVESVDKNTPGINPTTPPPIDLEDAVIDLENKDEEKTSRFEEDWQKFLKRKEELVREANEKQNDNKEEFVYITPNNEISEVVLSNEDKEVLALLSKNLRQDETEFINEFSQTISQKMSEIPNFSFSSEEIDDMSLEIAATFAEKLSVLDPNNIPDKMPVFNLAEPLVKIAQDTNLSLFESPEKLKDFQTMIAASVENQRVYSEIAVSLLNPVVGVNIGQAFFPSIPVSKTGEEIDKEYSLSDQGDKQAPIQVSKEQIRKLADYANIYRQVESELESMGVDLKDSEVREITRILSRINQGNKLIGFASRRYQRDVPSVAYQASVNQERFHDVFSLISGSFKSQVKLTLDPETKVFQFTLKNLPHLSGVATRLGNNLFTRFPGLAKFATSKTANILFKEGVTKTGTALATKAAGSILTKLGLQGVLQAFGSLAPGIGNLLALVIGFLIDIVWSLIKKFVNFIKKNWKKALALLSIPFLIGAYMTGSSIMGVAGMGLAIPAAAPLGVALIGGIGAMFGSLLITIGTTILLTSVGLIILVILIAYIINTSAYVAPPSPINTIGGLPGGGGGIPTQCTGTNSTPPTNISPTFSSDNKYAFPIAPYSETSYPCYHWDGGLAVDVFTSSSMLPVVAYTNGVVTWVIQDDPLGGRYVILKGDDGRYYYYAHNCELFVTKGQRVKTGELLATTDSTGNAVGTPEHLHFAINNSDTFLGGEGNVCPQSDFEQKFGFGRCSPYNSCISP